MKTYRNKHYRVFTALTTLLLFMTLIPGHNQSLTRLRAAPAFLAPGQTYTTPDGAYTINYPDGWIVKSPSAGTITFATDQAALDSTDKSPSPTLTAGQAIILVQYITDKTQLPPGADVTSGAQTYLSSLLKAGFPFKVGKVQPVSLGNLDIASATLSDKGFAGVVYTFFEGKVPFITSVATAPGELPVYQFVAEAMIQSITPTQTSVTMQATMAATSETTPAPATMQATVAANSVGINLSQSGMTPDKNFSFNYPGGWASRPAGNTGMTLGTSQAALSATTLKSGEVVIQVEDFPKGGSFPPGAKLDAGPIALLKSLILPSSSVAYTYSEVKAYKLGQIDAARVDITGTDIAGVGYAFLVGDMPFVVIGATAPGETEANIALIEAVAQSIKPVGQSAVPTQAATQSATQAASNGTPIDLSQKFTFPDFVIKVNYPAGWVAKKVSGYVIVGNSDAAVAAATSSSAQLGAGEVAILIQENLLRAANMTDDDLTNMLKALVPSKPPMLVSPPTTYKIGGTIDTVRIIARGPQLDVVGFVFRWKQNSSFIVVAGTAPGELFADMPTIEAIVESIGPNEDLPKSVTPTP